MSVVLINPFEVPQGQEEAFLKGWHEAAKDFEAKRRTYYEALHQPLDADSFIQRLQQEMTAALEQLNRTLPDNPQVQLLPKG